MKTYLLVIVANLVTGFCASGQLVLRAGQVQSFDYRLLPSGIPCYPSYSGAPNSAGVAVTLDDESQQPGNSFQMEILNRLNSGTVASQVWTGSNSSLSLSATGSFSPGAVRLTGLTGSVTITSITMPWSQNQQSVFPPHPFESCSYDGILFVPTLHLAIRELSPSEVRLSWTTNAVDYRLEATDSLSMIEWSKVTNAPSTEGGCFVVKADSLASQRYFRLRKP